GVEEPARTGEGELDAGERGARAAFVEDDMRSFADDDLVARTRLDRDRELVAHRPGGDEERGLFPGQPCDLTLELVHGRVVAEDVVADFGAGDRLAHG